MLLKRGKTNVYWGFRWETVNKVVILSCKNREKVTLRNIANLCQCAFPTHPNYEDLFQVFGIFSHGIDTLYEQH